MIIVIQCAGRKRPEAGCLRRRDGQLVTFVADPENVPAGMPDTYARPDDIADTGKSWRTELLRYNAAPGNNPLGLLPAWQLYENGTYELLAKRFGLDHLYILSAGWGMIAANFLTLRYDITFKLIKGQKYTRRLKSDQYNDLRMLPEDTHEPVVFFISKGYVRLACELTEGVKGPRYLFYNSKTVPDAPGCELKNYTTRTRTNWQYECAKAFMDGKISV